MSLFIRAPSLQCPYDVSKMVSDMVYTLRPIPNRAQLLPHVTQPVAAAGTECAWEFLQNYRDLLVSPDPYWPSAWVTWARGAPATLEACHGRGCMK